MAIVLISEIIIEFYHLHQSHTHPFDFPFLQIMAKQEVLHLHLKDLAIEIEKPNRMSKVPTLIRIGSAEDDSSAAIVLRSVREAVQLGDDAE